MSQKICLSVKVSKTTKCGFITDISKSESKKIAKYSVTIDMSICESKNNKNCDATTDVPK